jgi:hypothetical protein
MGRNPSVTVKNAVARNTCNTRPANGNVHRNVLSEVNNIFFSSFPNFLPKDKPYQAVEKVFFAG